MSNQVIVIGGGLAGLSAAHTILQAGGSVVLLDKKAFCGGNSTKATSGINGAGTQIQAAQGVTDSKELFEEDTVRSGTGAYTGPLPASWPLATTLAYDSPDAVDWLVNAFKLPLDKVSRLGGHSAPRTHRSEAGGKFPGMMITYKLLVELEEIAKKDPSRARIINRAQVTKLITEGGKVVGAVYKHAKTGVVKQEHGSVIVATGGYGAGVLKKGSVLSKLRPDLMHLPTTNGDHCTGDAIEFVGDIGGAMIDLDFVQVHPTGIVHPKFKDDKIKFLAAGALRGEGGIIVDKDGHRFCNDLGTRDYVSGSMWKRDKAPYRLVLTSGAAAGIDWHCRHYAGRGIMKKIVGGYALAAEIGCPSGHIVETLKEYNASRKAGKDPHGLKFFQKKDLFFNDTYMVAEITPVVHYCMGGIKINEKAQVESKNGGVIPGLYAAGEVAGGVHGRNRLGGSALLECVVFGRVAGRTVAQDLGGFSGVSSTGISAGPAASDAAAPSGGSSSGKKEYTLAEVAKHTTEDDCWVVINGEVLNATAFLDDHPGGKMAIMSFAGRDASEEFNMLHDADVIEKYAPELVIGVLKKQSKL